MPGTLEILGETVAEWLTQEEVALRAMRRKKDPAMAKRLRLWTERLQAYERLESALAQRRVELPQSGPGELRPLPKAVKDGLRLVP
jgi:hypothetical protein